MTNGSVTADLALPAERSLDHARLLAVIQGTLWFVLLIHGGKGLIFGPLAWLAVFIGTRFPGIAAGLLLMPVAWLCQSWAPILLDGPAASDLLIVGTLVVPAIVASMVFIRETVRRLVAAAAK